MQKECFFTDTGMTADLVDYQSLCLMAVALLPNNPCRGEVHFML